MGWLALVIIIWLLVKAGEKDKALEKRDSEAKRMHEIFMAGVYSGKQPPPGARTPDYTVHPTTIPLNRRLK